MKIIIFILFVILASCGDEGIKNTNKTVSNDCTSEQPLVIPSKNQLLSVIDSEFLNGNVWEKSKSQIALSFFAKKNEDLMEKLENRISQTLNEVKNLEYLVHAGIALDTPTQYLFFGKKKSLKNEIVKAVITAFNQFEHTWNGKIYEFEKNDPMYQGHLPMNQYMSFVQILALVDFFQGTKLFEQRILKIMDYAKKELTTTDTGAIIWKYTKRHPKMDDLGHGSLVIRAYQTLAMVGYTDESIYLNMLRSIDELAWNNNTCGFSFRVDGTEAKKRSGDDACRWYVMFEKQNPSLFDKCSQKLGERKSDYLGFSYVLNGEIK